MVKARRSAALIAAIALVAMTSISCSGAKPRIVFGYIGLVYYQESGGPKERFSFFVLPEDDDGIENLSDLYLYHDREQLRWHIGSDEWISYNQDGRIWIGTRAIAVADGETLPRGQFRAVLVNMGGESTERNFTFDAPEAPRFPFPTLTIADGNFTVASRYPVNRLVVYDAQGGFLGMVELSDLSGPVSGIGIPAGGSLAALWAEDSLRFTSAFTDAVPIR